MVLVEVTCMHSSMVLLKEVIKEKISHVKDAMNEILQAEDP